MAGWAWRELLERIENESKAYGSDLIWVPEYAHLTGMWNSCTLIVLSIRAYILFIVALLRFHSHVTGMCNSCKFIVLLIDASILFIAAMIALPLRRHWDCGAHDSFQGGIPMLSIASQCIHVTIPLPLDLFHPVTLFSSERRPAALVLSILKGAPGFCA